MNMRRALVLAAAISFLSAGHAAAQFGYPGQAPQQPQEPPCLKDFKPLRDDAQKKANLIQAASARHATPAEACKLFNSFSAAEDKAVKFMEANFTTCGIPPQVLESMKNNHLRTLDIRKKVCDVAANPPRPAGPSLSDALGGSAVPDANNIKTGRGTFDTLTGTPLGNK